MRTQFEYTIVNDTFDLSTDPTPHNPAWDPFGNKRMHFDIRRLPTGNNIWIRRRHEEMGPGYTLNISSGNEDLLKYTGRWPVWDCQNAFPPPESIERCGMYMLSILVRPVADADTPMVLTLTKIIVQHGNVRIDASGASSGALMWSETYGAHDSVRGVELRYTIQHHLVRQGTLTRSSPTVRLLMEGVVVRGNKILNHPTEFGKTNPARTHYSKTRSMNTTRRYVKRKYTGLVSMRSRRGDVSHNTIG